MSAFWLSLCEVHVKKVICSSIVHDRSDSEYWSREMTDLSSPACHTQAQEGVALVGLKKLEPMVVGAFGLHSPSKDSKGFAANKRIKEDRQVLKDLSGLACHNQAKNDGHQLNALTGNKSSKSPVPKLDLKPMVVGAFALRSPSKDSKDFAPNNQINDSGSRQALTDLSGLACNDEAQEDGHRQKALLGDLGSCKKLCSRICRCGKWNREITDSSSPACPTQAQEEEEEALLGLQTLSDPDSDLKPTVLGTLGLHGPSGNSTDFSSNVHTKEECYQQEIQDFSNLACHSQAQEDAQRLKALIGDKKFKYTDFDLKATVGTGTFGRVRVVKLKEGEDTSTPFAMKIMQKSKVIQCRQVEHVRDEKNILMKISHPFIVNLFATFQDQQNLYMLMEYVNGGELYSLMRKSERLSTESSRFYSAHVVLAFKYLHGFRILYRDLKPENLLLTCDGNIKITDFGFAKKVENCAWTQCGTPEYMAPEMILCKGYGRAVDWWALGVLIFEMLAGYSPFEDCCVSSIYRKVLEARVDFPADFDQENKDLIEMLLRVDYTERLGYSGDVQQHKWYNDFDWQMLLSCRLPPPWRPHVKSPDDTTMFDEYSEKVEAFDRIISAQEQKQFNCFG